MFLRFTTFSQNQIIKEASEIHLGHSVITCTELDYTAFIYSANTYWSTIDPHSEAKKMIKIQSKYRSKYSWLRSASHYNTGWDVLNLKGSTRWYRGVWESFSGETNLNLNPALVEKQNFYFERNLKDESVNVNKLETPTHFNLFFLTSEWLSGRGAIHLLHWKQQRK